ncbi:MAG TPA: cytochrome c1, partial [Gammaproteobacteria bacterium]|nr:cytochrome c1 [Gammaproteobacteria bacterium]
MKKIIFTLLVLLAPVQVWASGGCGQLPHCDAVDIDLSNQASLQNGARLFVNYCLSCHSASFMRYNRLGADLGIDDDKLLDNLMFVADFR